MFGAGREEQALSKVAFAVRKRLPWLQVNLATAFLASLVVGFFRGNNCTNNHPCCLFTSGRGAIRKYRFPGTGGNYARTGPERNKNFTMVQGRAKGDYGWVNKWHCRGAYHGYNCLFLGIFHGNSHCHWNFYDNLNDNSRLCRSSHSNVT